MTETVITAMKIILILAFAGLVAVAFFGTAFFNHYIQEIEEETEIEEDNTILKP